MRLFSAAGLSALFAFSVPSVFSVFSVSSVPSVSVGIPSVAGISSVIQTGSGALSIVQNIADEPDARVRKVADAVDKAAFARVFTANNIHRTIGISRKHLCIRKDGAGRGIQNDKLRNLAQSVDELCHFIGAEKLGGIVRSGIAVDYKKIIHRLADNVRKLRRAVKISTVHLPSCASATAVFSATVVLPSPGTELANKMTLSPCSSADF